MVEKVCRAQLYVQGKRRIDTQLTLLNIPRDDIVFLKLMCDLVYFSGITYLRDFLNLPPEIVPATLRRQARTETARPRPKGRLSLQFVLQKLIHLSKGKI